jgi:predicted alpha/beta superfamily hydrolase
MKAILTAVIVTLSVSVLGTALAAHYYFNRPVFADGVRVSTLSSRVLGEERQFIVHLPEGYEAEPGHRYPVLYVLDGTSQDGHTAHSAALMARIGTMPELIVVGLPNVSGEGRQRDYTPPFMAQDLDVPDSPMGRGDRFLAFLQTELIPSIESQYRAEPIRMLAGHSRGGLLAVYSLMAVPELFHARFAHSPALWRDDTIIATKLGGWLDANPSASSFLYLSLGMRENEEMTAAFEKVRTVLAAHAPPGLRWKADRTRGADHQDNGELATPVGFRALYRDWQPR